MEKQFYDIGKLKDDPLSLHRLAIMFDPADIIFNPAWDQSSEIYKVLVKLCNSLWANLPPVIVYDYRDPDDPDTWGDFPPSRLGFDS